MIDFDLFHPPPPVAPGSASSRRAARRIEPRRASCRAQIAVALEAAGILGATRAELAAATGLKENTVNGRVHEMLRALPDPEAYELGERRDGRAVVVGPHAWDLLMTARTRTARASKEEPWRPGE